MSDIAREIIRALNRHPETRALLVSSDPPADLPFRLYGITEIRVLCRALPADIFLAAWREVMHHLSAH